MGVLRRATESKVGVGWLVVWVDVVWFGGF